MADVRICPTCGTDIPADAPAELCPQCLLRAGLASKEGGRSNEEAATAPHPPGHGEFVPPLPSELRKRLPQFEFVELLGQGGMGAVYKARQPNLDRMVAVKILPPDAGDDSAFAERFAREARAMARLSHPHIVNVYDFGQADGQFYLVMEYVDGVNLRQAIRAATMSPKAALDVVVQICEALQYAHDEGVVHRDIKPENILLDRRGRVKIADFGLAKMMGGSGAAKELTGTHQVLGTLRYMAPEQIEGSRAVDHRADIYSLGVVFYELLTGEVPMGRFQPPSAKVAVDVRIDEVVLKSLEREPERRYQHASEVKSDVDAVACSAVATKSAVQVGEESDLDRLMRRMVRENKGLAAIRAYRAATGAGLSEAHAAVRRIAEAEGVPLKRLSTQQRVNEIAVASIAMAIGLFMGGTENYWTVKSVGLIAYVGFLISHALGARRDRKLLSQQAGDVEAGSQAVGNDSSAAMGTVPSRVGDAPPAVDFTLRQEAASRIATSPEPSNSSLSDLGSSVVAFGAAMGVLGLLWQFHSYQVLAVGVLALAGIAIWRVQWIEAKRGSPTPDRIGVVVAAVALAALLQWSLKAGLEAARVVKFPGQWELVIAIGLPLTLFLMACIFPAIWRRLVLRGSGEAGTSVGFAWRRLPLLVIGVLFMAAGLVGLLNMFLVVLDSAYWHPHAVARAAFEQKYAGHEADLLGLLPTTVEAPARMRLTADRTVDFLTDVHVVSGYRPGAWGLNEWVTLMFGLLIYSCLIGAGIDFSQNECTKDSAAFSRKALTVIGPVGVVLLACGMFTMLTQSPLREAFQEEGLYQTIQGAGPAKDFSNKIGAWLHGRGFHPNANWGFRVEPAEGGERVGEYRYALFEPNSLFGKWDVSIFGIRRREPLLIVTQLSHVGTQQNLITIDARSEFGRFDSSKWVIVVNELKEAIAGVGALKAPDESDKTSQQVKKPEESARQPTPEEMAEAKVFYELGEELRAAFKQSDFDAVESNAEAYLALAAKFPDDWNYGNAIHDGNAMLGLGALVRGRMDQAKERLRAAGKATTTPQLASFGPDLELAAALVALGQRQAVVDYLNDCRSFWPTGGEKIDRMVKALEGNSLPWEFRAILKSPLIGEWLAAAGTPPSDSPREFLKFTEEGRFEPSVYGERHSTFRRDGEKVTIADPEAPDRRDKDDVFELKGDRLFMPKDDEELPFTLPKDGLRRLDGTDAQRPLIGTWVGSVRFEGMGNARLTWSFDADDAGSCTITVRAPSGVSFRYAVIGDRLVYTFADSSIAALGQALQGAQAQDLVRSSTWKVDDDDLTIDDYWHAEPSGDKRRTFQRFQSSDADPAVR